MAVFFPPFFCLAHNDKNKPSLYPHIKGWLVDAKGARAAICVGQLSGGLSYFFLAVAWSVPMLFLSKIPTVFQHCLQAAQMCVILMSDEQSRPKMVARLSFYYGLGFVVGPMIGGQLSALLGEQGHQSVAMIAAIISIICVVLNLKFLPPLLARDLSRAGGKSTEKEVPSSTSISQPSLSAAGAPTTEEHRKLFSMVKMVFRPQLRILLLFSFLVGMALSSFYSSFSMAAEPRFGMDEKGLGAVMSYIGGLSMVINLFVIPMISERFSKSSAVFGALFLMMLAFVGLSFAADPASLYFIILPLVLSMAIFRAYSVSLVTDAVQKEEAGSAIGLAHAAGSLSGVVAPAISGHVFRLFGFEINCMTQAMIVFLAGILLFLKAPFISSYASVTVLADSKKRE